LNYRRRGILHTWFYILRREKVIFAWRIKPVPLMLTTYLKEVLNPSPVLNLFLQVKSTAGLLNMSLGEGDGYED
jgi:hypothetical protein